MAERFAFAAGEETNLLIPKPGPENTKNIPSYTVQIHKARYQISHGFKYKFHFVQQSKERRAKRRRVVSHCQSRVAGFNFLSVRRKEKVINKPLNEFTKEELVNILRKLYVKAHCRNSISNSRWPG